MECKRRHLLRVESQGQGKQVLKRTRLMCAYVQQEHSNLGREGKDHTGMEKGSWEGGGGGGGGEERGRKGEGRRERERGGGKNGR